MNLKDRKTQIMLGVIAILALGSFYTNVIQQPGAPPAPQIAAPVPGNPLNAPGANGTKTQTTDNSSKPTPSSTKPKKTSSSDAAIIAASRTPWPGTQPIRNPGRNPYKPAAGATTTPGG